jgi:hypothetical protein
MPKSSMRTTLSRHSDLLTFEEVRGWPRLCSTASKRSPHGRRAVVAQDLHKLIAMLSPMKTRDGNELDIALTTNGSVLPQGTPAGRRRSELPFRSTGSMTRRFGA